MTVDSIVSAAHLSAVEKIGTRLEDTFTAEDAMKQGLLGGWNVRKWPAVATVLAPMSQPVHRPPLKVISATARAG